MKPNANTDSRNELFPCIGCGACCEAAPGTRELIEAGYIVMLPSGEQKCRLYNPREKLCLEYDSGPDICVSAKYKEANMPDMPDAEFARMSMKACIALNERKEDYRSANAVKKLLKKI